jgi:hypothetical protein
LQIGKKKQLFFGTAADYQKSKIGRTFLETGGAALA